MQGLIVPAILENITTRKDGTLKLVLGTQELGEEKAGKLFSMMNRLTATYISGKETISQEEIDVVDKLDPEFTTKSQSQRLRAVLFRAWEHDPQGYKTFNNYYQYRTDMLIDKIKSELP